MKKLTSFYLDLIRVIAAFGVLFVHCNLLWFSNNKFLPPQLGHKLVMIFFVLSGFLIAYSTIGKDKNMKSYFIDRFSRLYSVVIPALILTYLLDSISRSYRPALFQQIPLENQFFKFVFNLLFIQQIWDFSTKPSSNGPFWSLSYEFWYYCLFGFLFYLRGYKRIIILSLTLLLIGPKIILLLPVWLYGVMALYLSQRIIIQPGLSTFIFVVSIVAIGWNICLDDGSNMGTFGNPPLYFSSLYLYDWGFGLLVAINLYSVTHINFNIKVPELLKSIIAYFSSVSFSLYLFHFPFLVLAAALIPYNKNSYLHLYTIIAIIIFIICILSKFTESRRGIYKKNINKIINFFEYKIFSKISSEVK